METYHKFEWVYYFSYLCLVLLMRQLKVTYVEIKFSKMNSFLTRRGAHLSKEKMYTKILL